MSGYCIRIQQLPSYDEKIALLVMCSDYQSILCYKHLGDSKENPHYHLVIRTQVKSKAFRARFVKIFDLAKGNQHMSIKEWDGNDDAYSYMTHEGNQYFLKHRILDEDIARYVKQNDRIQEEMKKAKGKASWLLENEVLAQLASGTFYSDLELGVMTLRTALLKDKYQPNDFQLRLMVDRIQYKSRNGDEESQDQLLNSIARRALKL